MRCTHVLCNSGTRKLSMAIASACFHRQCQRPESGGWGAGDFVTALNWAVDFSSREKFLGTNFMWLSGCSVLGQNFSWVWNFGLRASCAGSLERENKPDVETGKNALTTMRPAHPGGLGRWSGSPKSWAGTNPYSHILSWSCPPALIAVQDWMKSRAMARLGLQV